MGSIVNYYITKKMIDIVQNSMVFNPRRLHNKVIGKHRKGSWVARCVEWDNYYKSNKSVYSGGRFFRVVRHGSLKVVDLGDV